MATDKFLEPPTYLSFATNLDEVISHQLAVKSAMAAQKHEEAHVAMHAIVNLIEALPISGRNSHLPDDLQGRVAEGTEILSDAFGRIDRSMHSDAETVVYADVADDVERGLQVLRSVQQTLQAREPAEHTASH